jgi:hypothetical protein
MSAFVFSSLETLPGGKIRRFSVFPAESGRKSGPLWTRVDSPEAGIEACQRSQGGRMEKRGEDTGRDDRAPADKDDERPKRDDAEIDEVSEESFPASDPPSF